MALSDEGEAHDVVRDTGFALALREAVLEERRAEGNRERRDHAACNDGSHDVELTGSQEARARDVSSLVDRATHIDGHHASDDHAHEDTGRRVHVLQRVDHPAVDGGDRRRDDEEADEAHASGCRRTGR